MAIPGWVDESGGAMDQQAEAPERALALDALHEVVRQAEALSRRPEHELARMQDERGPVLHLDELGDVVERSREVDERVPARAKDAEAVIEPDVDGCRLHAARVERVDDDPPARDRRADVTVGQDHESRVWRERA